jgi:type II secretory ATPase GspE/PulE/Tfp pilus assembly ATPase PilB-like protein
MVLVTGPTGSGKTTTLYSMMQDLNTPERKIITLEDPIEYELRGVVQSEVNETHGYSFHSGLKALLRQDPDIIMIGEIRDLETANTAAQAALTGHLVLSTLHTKSASETLERLINMGLPPYILASAIDIIIAQRLVRKLCPHCSNSYTADEAQNDTIKWMMKDIGIDAVARAKK